MNSQWSARGGRALVFLRAAREVGPLLKGYVRLVRAETALAAASVRGLSIALVLAMVGALIVLIAIITALMAWLIQSGIPVWQALLWMLIPGVLLTSIGVIGTIKRFGLLTLPQTRKRVRMLLELIDEER